MTRLVLAAVVGLSSISAALAGSFEKALPGDAALFVNIANVTTLKASVTETRLAKLLSDPAMKPFVDGFMGEITKLLDMAEQIGGISIPQILNLPTGQVSLALKTREGEGLPTIYFLASCKGNEDAVKSLLDKIFTTAEEVGMNKKEEGDLTIFSQGEGSPGAQVAIAFKNGVLVIGNDSEALNAAIAGLEGGVKDSLADNADFRAFREKAGGEGDGEVYGNLAKAIEMYSGSAGAEVEGMVAMLGLNAFKSAGLSVAVGKGDYEASMQVVVNTKGQTPIFNLLNMPAKPTKPEKWVPENIVSYTSFNWDVELFYSTLTGIVNAASPGMMAQVDAMLAGPDPDNPLLNIKDDLIGPLGNRLSILSDVADVDGKSTARTLIAWELDDSDKLNALIDRVMALAGGALPLQNKMVKGTKVYHFPLGDLLAAQMPDGELPIAVGEFAFAISKTHFFLTTHLEFLDKILESEGSGSLAESSDYQKVAAQFPANTSLIQYTKADEQIRALWATLKSGALADMLRKQMEQSDEMSAFLSGLVDSLDGKNLPDFDAIKQYMAPTGGYAIMNDTGVHFITFTLKN